MTATADHPVYRTSRAIAMLSEQTREVFGRLFSVVNGSRAQSPSRDVGLSGAKRRLSDDDSGAIMVMGIFLAALLIGVLYYVVGIADAIAQREEMQDGSDAAALSAAITMARGMNFIVLLNMLMAALVLVILILKLIVTLLGIAAVVLAACFLYPLAATVAGWAAQVYDVAVEAEDIIFQVLEVCNYIQKIVKIVVPVGAELQVIAEAPTEPSGRIYTGFVLPESWELPVEAGSYSKTCGKAGELLAGLVMTLIPLPGAAQDAVKSAVGGLAEALSFWFCGDGDTPPMKSGTVPKAKFEFDRAYPLTPNSLDCEEELLSGGSDIMSTGESLSSYNFDDPRLETADVDKAVKDFQASSRCAAEKQDRKRSLPDLTTGLCTGECEEDEYEENLTQARIDCNPDTRISKAGGPSDFVYTTATIVDTYEWDGSTWVLVDQDIQNVAVVGERPDKDSTERGRKYPNPCVSHDDYRSYYDYETPWTLEVHPSDNPEFTNPVCGRTMQGLPSDTRRVEIGKRYNTVPYSAVLNILMCSRHIESEREISMGGLEGKDLSQSDQTFGGESGSGGGEGGDKSCHLVKEGLSQGDSDFQVRSLVIGKGGGGAFADRFIKHSSWGREIVFDEPWLEAVDSLNLTQFSVSQAELYFEPVEGDREKKSTDNESWNWEMGWRARLVPFTLPGGDDEESSGSSSNSSSGSPGNSSSNSTTSFSSGSSGDGGSSMQNSGAFQEVSLGFPMDQLGVELPFTSLESLCGLIGDPCATVLQTTDMIAGAINH